MHLSLIRSPPCTITWTAQNELGEALTARTEVLCMAPISELYRTRALNLLRTANFRELGPPDLCHIIKTTGRSGQRDLGSYHFVSGVDASSSASLAAYINSLTYAIEDNSAWFSKSTAWKVKNGSYWCVSGSVLYLSLA
jgi:Chs5-Arf1p-binding protein BUD7/BCH1